MTMEGQISDPRTVHDQDPPTEEEPWRLTFVHQTDRASAGVATIRGGGGIPPHIHREHDELIVMIEGEADFRLGDSVERVRPGQAVTVPAGTVHAPVLAHTDVVLFTVFSPFLDPDHPDRHFVD